MAMDRKTSGALSGAASGAAAGAAFGPWGAAIGGIAGGALGYLGSDGESGDEMRMKILDLMSKVQEPNFNPQDLTADEVPLLAQILPNFYNEIKLELPKEIVDNTEAVLEQKAAFNKIKQKSEGGLDLQAKADLNNAANQMNVASRGQEQAIINNLTNRGLNGGSLQAAQALRAQQLQAQGGQANAMNAAAENEKRVLQALAERANMATNMRNAEFAKNQANTNAFNNYQQQVWQNKQNIANANVDTQNQANQFNATNAQNVANTNTAARNQAKANRVNAEQFLANFRMQKAGGQAGAMGNIANAKDAAGAAQAAQMSGIFSAANSMAQNYQQNKLANEQAAREQAYRDKYLDMMGQIYGINKKENK